MFQHHDNVIFLLCVCWVVVACGVGCYKCSQVSNIRCTLAGYEIVDHSDVVGASPVGAAPTTSSFST